MTQAPDTSESTARRELEVLAEDESFGGQLARIWLGREAADD